MPPSGTFSTYKLHITWACPLTHRGLGFLSLWELLLVTIYLLHCHCLAIIQSKIPKTLASFIVYLSFLITNTFSSSWVRQPFLFERYYNWSPALGSHQEHRQVSNSGSVPWKTATNAGHLSCSTPIIWPILWHQPSIIGATKCPWSEAMRRATQATGEASSSPI